MSIQRSARGVGGAAKAKAASVGDIEQCVSGGPFRPVMQTSNPPLCAPAPETLRRLADVAAAVHAPFPAFGHWREPVAQQAAAWTPQHRSMLRPRAPVLSVQVDRRPRCRPSLEPVPALPARGTAAARPFSASMRPAGPEESLGGPCRATPAGIMRARRQRTMRYSCECPCEAPGRPGRSCLGRRPCRPMQGPPCCGPCDAATGPAPRAH